MKFGYTIVCVPDVAASLAFAAHGMGEMNFPDGHMHASDSLGPWAWRLARSPTASPSPMAGRPAS